MIHILRSNCRTTEAHGTGFSVLQTCQGGALRDGYFPAILSEFEPKVTALGLAINRLKSDSEKKGKDQIRDDKLSAFYFLLMGFSHHSTTEIRDAAQLLLGIFENYGLAMKDESYTAQTSLMHSFFSDLQQPEAQAAIAQVPSCIEYIDALWQAQAEFEAVEQAFAKARAQEGTLENATELKRQVLDTLNNLVIPFLNVALQVDEPNFGHMARTVAEIIDATNENVKRRRKKDESEEED